LQAFVASLGIGLLLMATMVIVALASGMTEVDAITLSTQRLFNQETLTAAPAVIAIGLAILASLLFKSGLWSPSAASNWHVGFCPEWGQLD
jgi:uncharacterized membrane protein (DUF4010 family)